MLLTDGRRTVRIEMRTWTGSNLTPDWSLDFFMAQNLQYDPDTEEYHVDNLDYCIDAANDWANKEGDFADDGFPPIEDRVVIIGEETTSCI